MVVSNIWITDEYEERIRNLLEDFNIFEVGSFFEKHQFRDVEEQTEDNTQDHDISIIDEYTFDVFVEHLPCYFSMKMRE